MGMGFPVTARLTERGMTPSLGADIVSNNSGDLFTQMRLGLACERARANEPLLREQRMPEALTVSAAEMLGWATLGGAKALGLDSETGSIVEGKAADLVLLRGDWTPPAEPVAQTVLQSSVRDVEAVMVAGELVKRDGRLVGEATERASRLAAESRERIFAAAEARGGLLPPAPDGFLEMTIGAMRHNLAGAPGMEG
jgi:cytosine/adenosine deaminase-related metal-dependent hydrolase